MGAWYTWQNALSLALGAWAFGLFLIYDINSFRWRKTFPKILFALGFAMLIAATALDIWSAIAMGAFSGAGDIVLTAIAAIFLGALIYCLFFALPFKETYAKDESGRKVCQTGVYGITRHPGIPMFFGMYLFLGLALLPGGAIINGMVFSALNFGYAVFQDNVTFPQTFCDYGEYKKKVPFMIPNHVKEK